MAAKQAASASNSIVIEFIDGDEEPDEISRNNQKEMETDKNATEMEVLSSSSLSSSQQLESTNETKDVSNEESESHSKVMTSNSMTDQQENVKENKPKYSEDDTNTEETLPPNQLDITVSETDKLGDEIIDEAINQESSEEIENYSLAYGMDAYRHYQLYVQIERKREIKKLEESKHQAVGKIVRRIEKIDEIMEKAKAYYRNPTGKAAKEWKEFRHGLERDSRTAMKSHTFLGHKLTQLHEHKPFFTVFIIIAQLASFCVICGFGGLTHIGFEPELKLMDGIQTFLGTETVHKWIIPNVWIGPSEKYFIGVGALFAPCMREDFGIQIDLNKLNYSVTEPLGCCEIARRNQAATTTEEECATLTHGAGRWRPEFTCSKRPPGQNSVAHTLKPCCVGTVGACEMLTYTHCTFLDGTFHKIDKEHCREVNCLSSLCKFGGLDSKTDKPWIAHSTKQWWRLPLSLLYHHGIIHTLLVVIVQFFLLRQIERSIGWLRVLIVYVLAGTGGLMAAALFDPYSPHMGGTGALFGFVGLIFMELVQFWRYIQKPKLELAKLVLVLLFFLFSGTLPYINNFSIIIGFLIGMLCSGAVLPYIGFSNIHIRCRIALIIFTIPLILLSFFLLFYLFYQVQTFDSCEICKRINCVSYTKNMCKKLT